MVCRLSPKRQATEWGAYYSDTNYSDEALEAKRHLVQELVRLVAPKTWWDVGGNNGFFSHAVRDLIAIYSKGRCDSYVYPTGHAGKCDARDLRLLVGRPLSHAAFGD